jgi:ATP-dependent metalloprotease FtsH
MNKDTLAGLGLIAILIIIVIAAAYYLIRFALNIKWADLMPLIILILLLIIVIFQILLFSRFNPNKSSKNEMSDKNNENPSENFSSLPLRTYQDLNDKNVTFDNVAGLAEAKDECKRILRYLNNPNKFKKIGAKMPKGFIFEGPPGMGKTYLAKALANEAKVNFFYVSASELIELFVGVGAARIRNIFHEAEQNTPCIIFIDELDAVAQKRSPVPSFSPGADEREQTINQLLAHLDGIESTEGIIVIAATNRIEVIDPALIRPGRFDSTLHVELTSSEDRVKLMDIITKNMKVSSLVSVVKMAGKMEDFSGAEIDVTCNRAALLAADDDSTEIGSRHFNEAIDFMLNQRKVESSFDKIFQMAMNSTFIVKEKHKVQIDTFSRGEIIGRLIWISPDSLKIETEDVNYIIPRGSISAIKEINS